MKLPIVAIIGRPNVGKSSLLNSIARERISIVEETPGVTRDRVSAVITSDNLTMELIDTGGIGIVDEADLSDHIERQIEFAVSGASAILFVTDVRDGVTELDRIVAQRLRPRAKEIPVFLVVNKVDSPKWEPHVLDFHELGLGEPLPVSAKEGFGRGVVLEKVAEHVEPTGEVDVDPVMKLAIIGRQNAGKSTFVNALAEEERVIVSEIPGTTRDAVDVRFEKDGREFVIIDTAGVQRKSRVKDSINFYSQVRTQHAIRRSDVVLFILDAREELARVEKRLAQTIAEGSHLCVIVANKWDLVVDQMTTEEYEKYLLKKLPNLYYAPIVCTTAKDSRNIQSVIDLAQNLYKLASRRVGTGELNRVIEAIREHQRPRVKSSKVPKIYYATQVSICPPTIVIFVNEAKLFGDSYKRYVENALREALNFHEVPIRIFFRERESMYDE